MRPPDRRNGRPCSETPASNIALDDDTSEYAPTRRPTRSGTTGAASRRCDSSFLTWSQRLERIRRGWRLDRALSDPPTPMPEPSDFGLSRAELRAEARRLFVAGWSVSEITAVLDIVPVVEP